MKSNCNLLVIFLMSLVLVLNQSCSDDRNMSNTLKEEMVAVNDYQLYTRTIGKEAPTVVLLTGIGGTTEDFESIEQSLAQFCKVINYDREGLGRSPWQNQPKDSETIAQELNALLLAKNINEPFILVAHSIGGLHARKFLDMYPEKVSGLVLLDPTPEDLMETLIGQLPLEFQQPARDAIQQEFDMMLSELAEGGVKRSIKQSRTVMLKLVH